MRTAFGFLILFLACGCAAQPRQWDKPGADRQMVQEDLRDCRRVAMNERRRYQQPDNVPRYTLPTSTSSSIGRADPYYARRQDERFINEPRTISVCMRNKGYELNPTPTDIRPTSPLR